MTSEDMIDLLLLKRNTITEIANMIEDKNISCDRGNDLFRLIQCGLDLQREQELLDWLKISPSEDAVEVITGLVRNRVNVSIKIYQLDKPGLIINGEEIPSSEDTFTFIRRKWFPILSKELFSTTIVEG